MKEKHMSKFKFGDLVSRRDGGLGVVIWSDGDMATITWQDQHRTPLDHYEGGSLDNITLARAGPNTVPVRIAVAVNDLGEWRVSGANGSDDATKRYRAADALDGDCLVTFITAHVPLPEQPAEVEGVVE